MITVIVLYFTLLTLGVAAGLARWYRLSVQLRLVWVVVVVTLISEAIVFLISAGRNSHWYAGHHFFSPVEATLVTIIFLTRGAQPPPRAAIALVAVGWIAIGVLNALFLQPLEKGNSNVSLLESFAIVVMALFALYRMAITRTVGNLTANPLFWFWSLALLFWGSTYFYWAFKTLPEAREMGFFKVVNYLHSFLNLALYGGVAALLFFIPRRRLQPAPIS